MADERKPASETQSEEKKFRFGGIFYHNTFVLIFSFAVALIFWFVMAMGDTDSNKIVYDVPISVQLSNAAAEDGLRVFSQSYTTADLEISGSSLITNKLIPDDFLVTATLNPTSTKLTGNTLQKMSVEVRVAKKSSVTDYTIVSIKPEEINLEYDRYKEVSFPIENGVKYSADSGFIAGTPTISETEVVVSGPESSVNKVSRAAVSYDVGSPLRADSSFACPVRLYDQNNQEITDMAGLYLEMNVDTVEVAIPVLPRKTVKLVATTIRQPKGFANSRITVEPAQIDIAGPEDVLAGISEITLDTPIDFGELTAGQNVFTLDIPLPAGVRNISAPGGNSVSQATVSVNLNGYKTAVVKVPADNIQFVNVPVGKEPELHNLLLEVTVIGSEAQVNKLTGESILVQADLTNFADRIGSMEVPATVTISGSGVDSCWAVGQHTVTVTLVEPAVRNTMGDTESSGTVAATPQE